MYSGRFCSLQVKHFSDRLFLFREIQVDHGFVHPRSSDHGQVPRAHGVFEILNIFSAQLLDLADPGVIIPADSHKSNSINRRRHGLVR